MSDRVNHRPRQRITREPIEPADDGVNEAPRRSWSAVNPHLLDRARPMRRLVAASVKRNLFTMEVSPGIFTVTRRGSKDVLFGPARFNETEKFIDSLPVTA